MKKNNGFLKIILIIIALTLLMVLLAILMPVALIGGLIATWYYTKKKPNQRNRNIAVTVAIVGLIGSILVTPNFINNHKQTTKTPSTTSTTTTSLKSDDNNQSSSTTPSSKKESTPSESEQTAKNEGPQYTKESNAEFAAAFQDMLNGALSENGISTTVRVEYYDDSLIYVYVPQEYKYETNVNIQRLADSIYQVKENKFREWATSKGFDLKKTYSPTLYLKSEDSTDLAEESGILNKKMKLKVNNS